MNFARIALIPIVAMVVSVPLAAQATSLWHPADGESSATFHSDHFKASKTRAQVLAELEAARKDGSFAKMQRGLSVPVQNTGPSKSRQQVIDELRNETPEARQARQAFTYGS